MKTFQWINMVGVFCILLGVYAILDSILMIRLTGAATQGLGANNTQPFKLMLSGYFGILVNVLYLIAGIFFLLKKSFSLRLMYAALILSLVASFAPILVLGLQQTNGFPWQMLNAFTLIGPTIDGLLLICVFRVHKYYFTDPDKQIYFFTSASPGPLTLKVLSIAGWMAVLVPLYLFILWLYIARMDLGSPEKIEKFYSYIPEILHTGYASNYLGLFCGVFSLVSSSMGLRLTGKIWRIMNVIVMYLTLILLMLNLWAMM